MESHKLLNCCLFFFFFYKIFFGYFAQIIRAIQTIQEEDAIEMIYLMLHDTREPAFRIYAYRLASYIQPLHNYFGSTTNIFTNITGNTQAALWSAFRALSLDDLR